MTIHCSSIFVDIDNFKICILFAVVSFVQLCDRNYKTDSFPPKAIKVISCISYSHVIWRN